MTSVLVEALPQEDPQVEKAAFSIRRTTCRANGIRQFYLEAGVGPPVILLHEFPETSFAWHFQIPALAPK
jgi:haloacetate dehalogenase